jgi:hypothetical protein
MTSNLRAVLMRVQNLKLWKLGFNYTDIVKCDGEFFLNFTIPKISENVYITTRISQLITLILRVVNFLNYYIAAV